MELTLRSQLIAWLQNDPSLMAQLNAVVEEAPSRTSLPWLAIAASASTDWSTKDKSGREVRVALELHCRGDQPNAAASLVSAIEARIASLPRNQSGYDIVGSQFLRARVEQRGESRRAILLEYRFRLLSN